MIYQQPGVHTELQKYGISESINFNGLIFEHYINPNYFWPNTEIKNVQDTHSCKPFTCIFIQSKNSVLLSQVGQCTAMPGNNRLDVAIANTCHDLDTVTGLDTVTPSDTANGTWSYMWCHGPTTHINILVGANVNYKNIVALALAGLIFRQCSECTGTATSPTNPVSRKWEWPRRGHVSPRLTFKGTTTHTSHKRVIPLVAPYKSYFKLRETIRS